MPNWRRFWRNLYAPFGNLPLEGRSTIQFLRARRWALSRGLCAQHLTGAFDRVPGSRCEECLKRLAGSGYRCGVQAGSLPPWENRVHGDGLDTVGISLLAGMVIEPDVGHRYASTQAGEGTGSECGRFMVLEFEP